jgi:hypothetical protein
MHGTTNLKFINAKQAGDTYVYKNIKQKLHKTIAAIWFNKTCREKDLKPNYKTNKPTTAENTTTCTVIW